MTILDERYHYIPNDKQIDKGAEIFYAKQETFKVTFHKATRSGIENDFTFFYPYPLQYGVAKMVAEQFNENPTSGYYAKVIDSATVEKTVDQNTIAEYGEAYPED